MSAPHFFNPFQRSQASSYSLWYFDFDAEADRSPRRFYSALDLIATGLNVVAPLAYSQILWIPGESTCFLNDLAICMGRESSLPRSIILTVMTILRGLDRVDVRARHFCLTPQQDWCIVALFLRPVSTVVWLEEDDWTGTHSEHLLGLG